MINILDVINSIGIIFLGIMYFTQDRNLKFMKAAMDSFNPEKLNEAQKFIDKGKEYEMKLKLSGEVKKITEMTGKRFQEVNKDLLSKYDELISIPFSILKDKDWEEREKHLEFYPKNSEFLRVLLEAFDNGEFPQN